MGSRLDAEELWYDYGRLFQSVSVTMRRHRVVHAQQLCACGRIAVRILPTFGLRCDIACEQWDRAYSAMQQVASQVRDWHDRPGPAIGRAAAPTGRPDPRK